MKTIINDSIDARYNLALEEHVLTNLQEDFVFLWQSDNSVIIGKNQNTVDEINTEYVEQENVNVVRRITGGGAVYHDLGNINFSYIMNVNDRSNTFRKFTSSVIEALKSYGIPAEFSGKNDILVNGMKISGNAQAIRGNRILHHGTLLFKSELTKLGKILKPKMDKLESNGVSSIESRVTNILPYFKEGEVPTIAEFKDKLLKTLLQIRDEDDIMPENIYELSENDKSAIDDLVMNKYSTDNWNYNNIEVSEFNVNKYCRYEGGGGITFRLKIIDEKIENVKIFGDFLGYGEISDIENNLKNVTFTRDIVKKKLQKFNLKKYFGNITLYNILDCLFNNNNNNNNSNRGFGVSIKSIFTELGSNLVKYNTTNKNRSIRMKFVNKSVVSNEYATSLSMENYTTDDLWYKDTDLNRYKVGFTIDTINGFEDDENNDFVFVDLPSVGKMCGPGITCFSVETVKIRSDIEIALTGTVVSINEKLRTTPELLNQNQWEWIIEIEKS
jgi:lipoate---protein ligase